MDIVKRILEDKIIAIMRGVFDENGVYLAEALHKGGIKLIEVTFDQNDLGTLKKTAAAIKTLSRYFNGEVLAGAGTVITVGQVEIAAEAGARYIISPNTDPAVIQKTKELGLVSIPGAMTPSEIMAAHIAGADFVKVFPAGNLGSGYIKAIRAPISHVRMMAVGGINEKNIGEFFEAGVCGVGVGGNLVNKKLIAEGKFDEISALAARFIKNIQ